MLTLRTKLALAVLHDIQYKDYQLSTSLNPSPSEVTYLLQKLSKGRLIALIENRPDNQSDSRPESYRLACAYHQINLLSILEALGEGVYFNRPSDEKILFLLWDDSPQTGHCQSDDTPLSDGNFHSRPPRE